MFYQSLYKLDNPSLQDISSFLSSVRCPTLSQEEQQEIGADITLEEVKKAIHDLQGGKSPGEDSLPPNFTKPFLISLPQGYLEFLRMQ